MTRLTLKAEPPDRLTAEGLLPERLAGLAPSAIERLPLPLGREAACVGDWFRVAPGDPDTLELEGALGRIDRIGAGMSTGGIRVAGAAGAYLGLGMTGGSLWVAGDAGFGAATALAGGEIRIAGDAGEAVGGALPGASGGMSGGLVHIAGNAGPWLGRRLRRGLIVVAGDAGPGCAGGMIAGTILVGGALGADPGTAMRRGTLIGLGATPPLAPSFADCGVHDLVILRLLWRALERAGLGGLAASQGGFRRFLGDLAVAGKGEILLAAR